MNLRAVARQSLTVLVGSCLSVCTPAVFFLIYPTGLAQAEDSPKAQEEIEQAIQSISENIEKEEQGAEQAVASISQLEANLKPIRSQIEKLKTEGKTLSQQLNTLSTQRRSVTDELTKLKAESKKLQAQAAGRIRALYMHPPEGRSGNLLRVASSDQMANAAYYLSRLQSYDSALLAQVGKAQTEADKRNEQLQKISDQSTQASNQLKVRQQELESQLATQEPMLKELRALKTQREKAVSSLRAQMLRFETLLGSLTGAPTVTRGARRSAMSQVQETSTFAGVGLEAQRSMLIKPAELKVVVPYGQPIKTDAGVAGSTKGLECVVSEGDEVRAVALGRVVFIGSMPIIGTVAILDHGQRWYSLYGRLTDTQIRRGEEVSRGSVVGKVGAPDAQGRNFYFEIRKAGASLDPAKLISF